MWCVVMSLEGCECPIPLSVHLCTYANETFPRYFLKLGRMEMSWSVAVCLVAGGLPELRLGSRSLRLSLFHLSGFQYLPQVFFIGQKAFILLPAVTQPSEL